MGKEDLDPPVLLSGSANASWLATSGYAAVALGHVLLLAVHANATGADGLLFFSLASVEVALAVEAAVYALGAFGATSNLQALSVLGRLRLLGAAVAWPWLLPWASNLSCRCGVVTPSTGLALVHHTVCISALVDWYFILREVQLLLKWSPSSGGASLTATAGCLPGDSFLGAQFRLDKADLEQTGRAVFVPAEPRQGLFLGAGLALLGHLLFSFAFLLAQPFPPYLFLGSLIAFIGRRCGSLPALRAAGEEKGAPTGAALLWRREGPRLLCRFGELIWIWLCLHELMRCEASPGWLSACTV